MSIEYRHEKAIQILEEIVGYDEEELNVIAWKGSFEEQVAYYASKRMLKALEDAMTEDAWKASQLSSPIESMMYLRLRDVQLEYINGMKFTPQVKIGPYTVDFLIQRNDMNVVIECDGHDFHEKTKQQAQHDKKRDRYLTSHGYRVFRYTGSEIYNGKIDVFEDLMTVFYESEDVPHGVD